MFSSWKRDTACNWSDLLYIEQNNDVRQLLSSLRSEPFFKHYVTKSDKQEERKFKSSESFPHCNGNGRYTFEFKIPSLPSPVKANKAVDKKIIKAIIEISAGAGAKVGILHPLWELIMYRSQAASECQCRLSQLDYSWGNPTPPSFAGRFKDSLHYFTLDKFWNCLGDFPRDSQTNPIFLCTGWNVWLISFVL